MFGSMSLGLAFLFAAFLASVEKRITLVAGNGDYENLNLPCLRP